MKALLEIGAVALLAPACGAVHPAFAQTPATMRSVTAKKQPSIAAIVAARKHAATVSAQRLLREFAVPPGASRAVPGAHNFHLSPFGGPLGKFVYIDRFWVTHASAASVASFENAHRPSGFSSSGTSSNRDGSRLQLRFAWPQHGQATRILSVSIEQWRARTVVRVDAQVVWVYPRSSQEIVPPSVREIDVKAPHVRRHVDDPATVHRIVRLFNGLPISPPGVSALCAVSTYVRVTLVFRSADGERLASAEVPATRAGICDTIGFTLRGKQQAPLIDNSRGPSFAARLLHVLGVRFNPPRR